MLSVSLESLTKHGDVKVEICQTAAGHLVYRLTQGQDIIVFDASVAPDLARLLNTVAA